MADDTSKARPDAAVAADFTCDRLTPEAIAAARLPAERAWSLPGEAYTSPDIFRLEIDRIFLRRWLCVGRVDQVPNAGDFFSIDLLDRPLVVVRGDDGGIRILSRVCRHRAADLSCGSGNAKTFRCPYHAWTYRNDGTLTGAPLTNDAPDFDKGAHGLQSFRCESWEGWIFVNFDDDAETLAARLTPLSERLAGYGIGDLVAVEVATYDSPFNWKVLVENFMESYHHIAIHRDTLEPVWPGDAAHVVEDFDPWSLLVMPSKEEHDGVEMPPSSEALEDWQKTALVAGAVWPTHLFAPAADSTAWYHVLPHSYDRFTLKIYACYPRSTVENPEFAEHIEARRELVKIVHAQDIHACEITWAGLVSGLARPGRLHRLERSIWQQNQWWLDNMESGVAGR